MSISTSGNQLYELSLIFLEKFYIAKKLIYTKIRILACISKKIFLKNLGEFPWWKA